MAVKEGAGWVASYVDTAKKTQSISDRTRGNAPKVTVPYKGRPKPKPKSKRPTAQPNKQPRARTKAIERREKAQAPSQFEADLESYKNTPGDPNMGMGGPPLAGGGRAPGQASPAPKAPQYKPYLPMMTAPAARPPAAAEYTTLRPDMQIAKDMDEAARGPQAPPAAHGSPWSHADPNAELPYEPWKPIARIGQAAAIAAKSIATGEKTYTVEDNPYQQSYPVVPMGAFGQVAPTTYEPRTDRSAYQLDPGVYSKERKLWDKTAPTLAGAAEAMNVGLEAATAMVTRTDEVMGLTPRLSGETGAYTYEESIKEYYAEHTPTERMVMEMANPLMWSLAGPKLGAINEANTLKKASNIASDVTLVALGEFGPLRKPVNAVWDTWHGALRTPYTKARNLAQDTSYVVNSVVDEVTDMSHILVKGDMGPVRKPVYIAKANDVVSTIEDFSVNPTRWRGDAAPDAADLLKSVDLEELNSIKIARENPYDNVNMLEFHGDLSDALMEKALIKKGALKPGQTIKDFKPNVIERVNANMKALTNAAWLVSGRYLVRNTANNYTTLMVDGVNIRGFDRQKFDSMRVMFNLDPISSHADELAQQMMGTGSMTGKALDKVPGFKQFREVSTGTGLVGEQRARDIATFDVAQKVWNENWVNKGRGVTPNYDGSYRPKGEVLHRGIPVASELDDAVSQSTRTARSVSELEKNIRDTVVGNRSPITAHFPDGYSPNLDEMNRLQRAADGGTLQAESRAMLIELEAQGRVAAYTDRLPVTVEDYGVGPNVTHQRSGNWLHPGANDEQMGAVQKGMNAYNRNVQKLSEDLAALSDMPYAHTVIPEEITRQQQLWYKHTEAADKLLEKAWKDINDGAPEVFVWERYYGETMPAHFDNAVKEQMAQIEKSSQLVRDVAEGKVSPRPGIDVDAELKEAHETYFRGFDERKFDVNGEKDFKSTLKTSRIATSGARMDASKAAMLAASQGDKAAMGRLVATLDETKRINGMAREFIEKNQPAWMAEGRRYFREETEKVWNTAARDNVQVYTELQEALAKNVSPDFHRTDANYGINRVFTADDETNAIMEMVKEVGATAEVPALLPSGKPRPTFGQGIGWKLHLTVDEANRPAVAKYLTDKNYHHKVGKHGGQTGKDITVYIGSRNDTQSVADLMNDDIGHLLSKPYGDVLGDDIPFAENIVGRFEVTKHYDDRIAQYGGLDEFGNATGMPWLKTDKSNFIWSKTPEGKVQAQIQGTRNARNLMEKEYGEFFTGVADEDAIHTINRAIKEANDDIVRGPRIAPDEAPFNYGDEVVPSQTAAPVPAARGVQRAEIPFISSGDDLKKTLRNATPEQREAIINRLGRKANGDEWIEYRRKDPAGAGRDEMRGSVTPQQSQVLDDMGQDVVGGMPDSHMPSQSAALRHELAEKRLHLNDLVENWEQGGGPTHRPWVPDDEVDELVGSYMNKYEQPFIDAKNAVAPYTKEKVDFSLLDYGDRTYIDMLLDMRYPYSFWQTRSMWNWGQRIMHKPGYAFAANRMNKAIDDQYRLEDGSYDPSIPARMRKKIKVDVPQGLIDKVPGDLLEGFSNTQFLANPANMFLPINDLTPSFEYSDPDDANSRLEEWRLWEEVLGAGRYPWVDFVETPLTGEKQVAVKEALPHLKAVSSLTALLAKKYPDSIFPAGGFMFGPQWGKWDTWRLQRMMVSQAAEAVGLPDADFSDLDELEEALIKRGNVDTTILMPYAQTIQQVIAWENGELSEAEIAALKEDTLYQTAATESGVENGVPSLLSFLTGLSVSPIMEGEMAVRAEKELAKSKLYDPNTALGSREEYLDIKEMTPETTIHREDAYQTMGLQNDLTAHEEKWRPALDSLIREKPAHFDEQADMRWEASKEKSEIYKEWFGAQDEIKDDSEMWSIYGARPEEVVQITIDQMFNELAGTRPQTKDFYEHPEAYDNSDAERRDRGQLDFAAYADALDEWYAGLDESARSNPTIAASLARLKQYEGEITATPITMLAQVTNREEMEDYLERERFDVTPLDGLVGEIKDIHYSYGEKRRVAYDETFGPGTAEKMDEYTAMVEEEFGEDVWDDVIAFNNEYKGQFGEDIYLRNAARLESVKAEYGEDIFETQSGYFDLPEGSKLRKNYLKNHPELADYWSNIDGYYEENDVPRQHFKYKQALIEKYGLEDYYEFTLPLKEELGIVEAKLGKHAIDQGIPGLLDSEATDYTDAVLERYPWFEEQGWDENVLNEAYSDVNMIPNSERAWMIAEAYDRDVDLEVIIAEHQALEFDGGPLPEIEKDPKKGKYRWKRYPRRNWPRRSYGGYPRSAKSKVWAEYYQTVEAQYGKEIWNTVSSYKEEYKALFGEDIFERNAARIAKAREYFGENIFDLQAEYFALPPDQQAAFLAANPMLQSYWDNSASLYEMFGMPTDHFDRRQEIRVKYGLADYFDYIRELKERLGVNEYSNYKPLQ